MKTIAINILFITKNKIILSLCKISFMYISVLTFNIKQKESQIVGKCANITHTCIYTHTCKHVVYSKAKESFFMAFF